jgi:hypothetical protein
MKFIYPNDFQHDFGVCLHIWVGTVLEPCNLSQTLQHLDMQSKFFEQTHFTLDFLSLLMSSHAFPSPNVATASRS